MERGKIKKSQLGNARVVDSDKSSSSNSDSSLSGTGTTLTGKKHSKRRKRKRNTERRSDSETSSSEESPAKKRRLKKKHKEKKKYKKKKKKLRKKKKRSKDKEKHDDMKKNKNKVEQETEDDTIGPSINATEPAEKQKRCMVPMTKEEYEKQQSVVRRVFDPVTGRNRLIKGDGEVIEEIVSLSRQKEINKQATRGDAASFQRMLGLDRQDVFER